jgi:hypothetical protein
MATKKTEHPTMENNSNAEKNTLHDFSFYEVKKLHNIMKTQIGNHLIY